MKIPYFISQKQETLTARFPGFPKFSSDGAGNSGVVSYRDPSVWGENCWLEYADYGFESPKEIKPFFTQLSQEEYEKGVRNFYVEVLADSQLEIQQWFELGFGLQHVSAILEDFTSVPPPQDVLIRAPRADDLAQIAELERELTIHQQGAPVFSALKPESAEEIINEWRSDLLDEGLIKFVAEYKGEVIALAYGCSTERSRLHSKLLRPQNSATLAFAAVAPQFRGEKIGRAVASRVIEELYATGFEHIVTDWRATNQLSSQTWPKLGFTPTLYRLHRAIT